MAALVPPQNTAGVPLPPVPTNPATLTDITNAKKYIEQLSSSQVGAQTNAATDSDIGAAEAYKAAVIFSHVPGGNNAPPWLANLNATVLQLTNDVANINANVAYLQQKCDEQPTLFANIQAGTSNSLKNPTILVNGLGVAMVPPNPQTRDELLTFTVPQCIASANNLGLPPLPMQSTVYNRRQQIANRIGVILY